MILISHRGNLDGPNPKSENHPIQISKAIDLGFNCEIDLHFMDGQFYLGHDFPTYKISSRWLLERKLFLWVHCKTLGTLNSLIEFKSPLNYFWHQNDFFTLTSHNFIWTYPGQDLTSNSIAVLPETISEINSKMLTLLNNCYGICSDYVLTISKLHKEVQY